MYNDAERLRVFRTHGLKGLIAHGYMTAASGVLDGLWSDGNDSNLELTKDPSLQIYAGSGLRNYPVQLMKSI